MAFASHQPKTGDTILHCGHLGHGKSRWFRFEVPAKFTRVDGSDGVAAWFAACEPCFIEHGDRVTECVYDDGLWTGDEPVIEQENLS